MTNQAKMIIITSNEDIIQQFSSRQIKDTHIIHLNNHHTTTNPTIDLSFLGELSGINSSSDQIYKRALDTTDHEQTTTTTTTTNAKIQKKSSDFICAVCGDHAIGFNYNALSCAPCKIFFRRNASQNLENLRCLSRQGQCSVAYGTRRKCPRCRLEKCFSVGMRKDFILTEDEIQRRQKKRQEQNTDTTSSTNDLPIVISDEINLDNIEFDTLSIDDWITIENLRSVFESIFGNDTVQCACVDVSDRNAALISWSHFIQKVLLRFIDLFRHVTEFQELDLDDRLNLVKCNIFPLMALSKCAHYSSENDCCSSDDNEMATNHRRFFMLCGAPYNMRDIFVNLVLSLVNITQQDPVILSLLSIILIVLPGLSMNENQTLLKDPLAINRVQFHYTQLLWNYLVNKLGDEEACRYFIRLLNMILQMQSDVKILRDFFRHQYMTSNIVDQMATLIQTVL